MTNMFTTLCTQCGATVFENAAQKYDQIKDMQLTYDPYGGVEYRFVYISHRCRAHDVATFETLMSGMYPEVVDTADLSAYYDAMHKAGQDFHNLLHKVAYSIACTKCGAEPNTPCSNLTVRKHGLDVPTKNPHRERLPKPSHADYENLEDLERDALGTQDMYRKIKALYEAQKALGLTD